MPSYKLTYFDVRGRAEVCRMIMAMAGQEFEDALVTGEEWPEMRKSVPLGQLPVMEVDGKTLLQSRAMASYLAREFGFNGSNSWETAMVDMLNGVVEDLWLPVVEIMYEEKDEAKKVERNKAYFTNKFPAIMKHLEEELCKNKGGDGFLVGDKITLADLNLHTAIETIEATAYPDMGLDKYPKVAALRERISAHEKLAPYLAKRKPSVV